MLTFLFNKNILKMASSRKMLQVALLRDENVSCYDAIKYNQAIIRVCIVGHHGSVKHVLEKDLKNSRLARRRNLTL